MLTEELRQIGFKLSVGEVERKLVSVFLNSAAGPASVDV